MFASVSLVSENNSQWSELFRDQRLVDHLLRVWKLRNTAAFGGTMTYDLAEGMQGRFKIQPDFWPKGPGERDVHVKNAVQMMVGFFKLSGEQGFLHFKKSDYLANRPLEQRRLVNRSASATYQHAIDLPA